MSSQLRLSQLFAWLKTAPIPGPRRKSWNRPPLRPQVAGAKPPVVVSVAFPVLYRGKHIAHAIDAGPGSKPEGIALLKKAVAQLPKDADLVIYCGCCPMVKCPNVRPAYRTLKEMGFTHIRVLDIPTNMHTDWYTKNYPTEAGSAAAQ